MLHLLKVVGTHFFNQRLMLSLRLHSMKRDLVRAFGARKYDRVLSVSLRHEDGVENAVWLVRRLLNQAVTVIDSRHPIRGLQTRMYVGRFHFFEHQILI